MKDHELFELAQAAMRIARHGATHYCHAQNVKIQSPTMLEERLRERVKCGLEEALNDAKEAIDCGMTQIAIATFNATIINCAIAAVKECVLMGDAVVA